MAEIIGLLFMIISSTLMYKYLPANVHLPLGILIGAVWFSIPVIYNNYKRNLKEMNK
jgi:hypothetical protein